VATQLQTFGRTSESPFEVVIAERPSGPPLTSTEQVLRAVLIIGFLGLLVIESWLLWHVWTLWA
jgi:hypothetical protein